MDCCFDWFRMEKAKINTATSAATKTPKIPRRKTMFYLALKERGKRVTIAPPAMAHA